MTPATINPTSSLPRPMNFSAGSTRLSAGLGPKARWKTSRTPARALVLYHLRSSLRGHRKQLGVSLAKVKTDILRAAQPLPKSSPAAHEPREPRSLMPMNPHDPKTRAPHSSDPPFAARSPPPHTLEARVLAGLPPRHCRGGDSRFPACRSLRGRSCAAFSDSRHRLGVGWHVRRSAGCRSALARISAPLGSLAPCRKRGEFSEISPVRSAALAVCGIALVATLYTTLFASGPPPTAPLRPTLTPALL